MFGRYQLHEAITRADTVVSVAKMKNHAFTGITGCTKNLFGLPPILPHGRVRSYFHHIIWLPYVLADLAMMIRPSLNVTDGLVGQSGREWEGEARVCDLIIAGDHPVATYAVQTHLMEIDQGGTRPPRTARGSSLGVLCPSGSRICTRPLTMNWAEMSA